MSYDYGVDVVADLVPLAIEYEIIKKAGSWFSVVNPYTGEVLTDANGDVIKFQGMLNLINYIRENQDIYDYIYTFINDQATGNVQCNQLEIDNETDKLAIIEANGEEPPEDIILR